MLTLKGKFLLRRSKTHDGKDALVIAGVFFPSSEVENFDERDEMWVAELCVLDSAKFVNVDSKHFSVEDFLDGSCGEMDPRNWQRKES